MGLAVALSPGVLNTPRYHVSWELHSMTDLKTYYDKILSLMEDRQYGMWRVLCEIFGREVGDQMAAAGQCIAMRLPKGVLLSPYKKRKNTTRVDEVVSSESEVDDRDRKRLCK